MKKYNQAPLPFVGQKRKFVKDVKNVLSLYPDNITIVDLFGGSGLLSHTAKHLKPKAHVVYNDFDNYRKRLEAITQTNKLIARIREVVGSYPKDKRLTDNIRTKILNIIKEEDEKGFVDYITLSCSLLFSMKYASSYNEFEKEAFYNVVRQSDYSAEGYLDGVEIVSKDYRLLFNEYKNKSNVLFLVDPPYLSTDVGTYTMNWRLKDYLDVLSVLQGHDYIYFTSNKSNILELCEWLGSNKELGNPFENATQVKINTTMNYSSKYTDIMVYKKQEV